MLAERTAYTKVNDDRGVLQPSQVKLEACELSQNSEVKQKDGIWVKVESDMDLGSDTNPVAKREVKQEMEQDLNPDVKPDIKPYVMPELRQTSSPKLSRTSVTSDPPPPPGQMPCPLARDEAFASGRLKDPGTHSVSSQRGPPKAKTVVQREPPGLEAQEPTEAVYQELHREEQEQQQDEVMQPEQVAGMEMGLAPGMPADDFQIPPIPAPPAIERDGHLAETLSPHSAGPAVAPPVSAARAVPETTAAPTKPCVLCPGSRMNDLLLVNGAAAALRGRHEGNSPPRAHRSCAEAVHEV